MAIIEKFLKPKKTARNAGNKTYKKTSNEKCETKVNKIVHREKKKS